ncbi:phage tail protein [Aliarcobacter butzleri]|uniref:phage tail protein n=1 Tax=Aliarcobacter butzleri TaxID=28197 RepID=UPI00263F17F0|nr:phage tail protein [Aliarcobacter butzleri]MDN5054443.1 phage tail protein [Aliarcobacter butzleri]
MNLTITQENKRLDEIVYNYYGSLEHFQKVLELNNITKVFLDLGDVIELPGIEELEEKKDEFSEVGGLW